VSHLEPADVVAMEPVPADAHLRYGGRPEQHVELRLPGGPGPHPVFVLLHGGCWQSRATVGYLGRLAREVARWGWATWTPEFRTVDHPDGRWPAILRDVADGVDHLRTAAAEHALELDRVVVGGHSSGGHLALWTAARPGLPADPGSGDAGPVPVRGVVGFAAICGVAAYHAMGEAARGCGDAVVRLLEGAPGERPDRLALVDPEARLPLGVPQLMLSGAADAIVPPAHVDAWTRTAREAGDAVEHHAIAGSAHFELVSPWTGPFAEVEAVLRPWLAELE